MKDLVVLSILLFFVSGVSFGYEQMASQRKETVEKKEPKVNFTWGEDKAGDKQTSSKKLRRAYPHQAVSAEKVQPKKVKVKPDKETPQWISNIKSDLRKLFLFEE